MVQNMVLPLTMADQQGNEQAMRSHGTDFVQVISDKFFCFPFNNFITDIYVLVNNMTLFCLCLS